MWKYAPVLAALAAFLLWAAGCATTSATYTDLDRACRVAARQLERDLAAGTPLALISLKTSELETYVVDELTDFLVRSRRRFQIYDRRQLAALAQERNFQLSGDVSDEQQRELGKMAGAQVVISVAITDMGEAIRIRVRAIDIESGRIVGNSPPLTVENGTARRLVQQVPNQPAPSPPPQDPNRNLPSITLRNNTGDTIFYVHISPITSESWGPDWLESSETIPNGGSRTFTLREPLSRENRYDFRMTDRNQVNYEKRNQTITDGQTITLTQSDRRSGGGNTGGGNTGGSGNTGGNPTITIQNNTDGPIWFLYITPAASSDWGTDWLGDTETFPKGSSKTVTLREPLNRVNRYHIRLADSRQNNFVKRDLTVTSGQIVTFTQADRTDNWKIGKAADNGPDARIAALAEAELLTADGGIGKFGKHAFTFRYGR